MAYSGKFRPRNPKKYRGDSSKIVYRSSWEARCMNYFDLNDNILWWASEEVIVPYRDPLTNKARRYFPDFIIKIKQRTSPPPPHFWERDDEQFNLLLIERAFC